MEQRRFFTRRDLPFFAGLLALGGLCAVLLALSPAGATAVVEVDGQVVLTRELSQLAGTEEVAVTGAGGIALTVELSPQGAAITSAGPGVRAHGDAHPGGGSGPVPARQSLPAADRGRRRGRRHLLGKEPV